MKLNLVPALSIQRELYAIPRGMARFWRYIETMTGRTDDIALPLMSMNPMTKPHVAARSARLSGRCGRSARRLDEPVSHGAATPLRAELKRRWMVVLAWSSERATPDSIRQQTLACAFRRAHFERHGTPRTLRERMRQEGLAATFAGMREGNLSEDDLRYSQDVLARYLDSTHYPTIVAALYGDEAARALGYTPLGLSARAGFGVAECEALLNATVPESAL